MIDKTFQFLLSGADICNVLLLKKCSEDDVRISILQSKTESGISLPWPHTKAMF